VKGVAMTDKPTPIPRNVREEIPEEGEG
jgi:hypothetical protein